MRDSVLDSEGRFKMSTVCEQTGFNQSLLRAWERRYGLLEPDRTTGGHRLYTGNDLRVLDRIKTLLDEGRSIGEIACIGRDGLLSAGESTWSAFGSFAASDGTPMSGPAGVDGERVENLVRAAQRIDDQAVERELDRAFVTFSAIEAVDRVLLPALARIGNLWELGEASVASEHLLTHRVQARMLGLLQVANPSLSRAGIAICACLPGEDHEIGALYCALTIASCGRRVTYLGARLPFDALVGAAERLHPDIVCLSVCTPTVFDREREGLLETARRLPAETQLIIGGPGVTGDFVELEHHRIHFVDGGPHALAEMIGS